MIRIIQPFTLADNQLIKKYKANQAKESKIFPKRGSYRFAKLLRVEPAMQRESLEIGFLPLKGFLSSFSLELSFWPEILFAETRLSKLCHH